MTERKASAGPGWFDVWVSGHPKGQPRGRAFITGGRPRISTPGTAEAWKGEIARAFEPLLPPAPITAPVRLWIDVYLPRPKRLLRKKDPTAPVACPGLPDWDNLGKAISDALEQVGVLANDKTVVDGRVRCWYHGKPGARINLPGARIQIDSVDAFGNRRQRRDP